MEDGTQEGPNGGPMVTLCGTDGCCPTIEKLPNGSFELRDDHGGKVVLKPEEFTALQSASFEK